MRVLWLAPFKHPKFSGHPAPWIEQLALNLCSRINLTIVSFSPYITKDIEVIYDYNMTLVFLKSLRPKLDIITCKCSKISILKQWLKKNIEKFDIIHIHGNEHQYEVACKNIKVPKVLSIQGIISECLKHFTPKGFQYVGWHLSRYYELRHYKSVNYYSCRTHWDQAIVRKHNPKAKIFNIWETIRPEFFIKDELKKKNNILYLGGAHRLKGIEIALKSFAAIKGKLNGKLLIGGNATKKQLKQIIGSEKIDISLDTDIEILGMLDAIGIVNNAKKSFCLLHPSLIDNSPNSVCEAQVMGLPVIAADVGGVSSLIMHGKTGLLTNHNPLLIAETIENLSQNNVLWQQISNQSRSVARERHNPDRIAGETIDMYNQIIMHNE